MPENEKHEMTRAKYYNRRMDRPSSFLLSCTIMNRIWLAVTNAETNHWLNLSIDFRYMLLVFHLCYKIRIDTLLIVKGSKLKVPFEYILHPPDPAQRAQWTDSNVDGRPSVNGQNREKTIRWIATTPFLHILQSSHFYLFAAGEFHFKYWIIKVSHDGKIIAASHFPRLCLQFIC